MSERVRYGLTMTAAHQLSSVTLPATNGTTIRLGDLWSEATTVLVFPVPGPPLSSSTGA